MAQGNSNLILQLLITAKDDASAAFGKLFSYLDDNTKVVAGKIRESFTGIFGGGLESAKSLEAAFDAVAAKGGYTAQEMEQLRQGAAQVAAQFGVTGQEAAQGLEILAAAGLSATEAIKTLPQVLALARAEGVSMDVAAERLVDSLAIMGLGFDEAGRMADVLAKGANLSTVAATQLAESLSTAGGVAKAAGLSLEETVAALDVLAANGIKGERAGTGLAAVLTQLLNPASTASKALNDLGISSRDLGDVLDGLQAAGTGSETAILAFGETAGPALRALLSQGSAGLNEYTAQLQNADGAAQQAAEGMSSNLESALAALNAALDTVKQTVAEPLLEPLAKAAQALSQSFIEAVNSGAFSGITDAIKVLATTAGDAAERLIKAFDFRAIGATTNEFVTGAMGPLGRALDNIGALAGGAAAAGIALLTQKTVAAIASTYEWVTAQLAARQALADQQILRTAQLRDELALAEAKQAAALAQLNQTRATLAHTQAVVAAMQANLGYGVSEAELTAAQRARVAAGAAVIAAQTGMTEATAATAAAQTALATATGATTTAMGLFSKAMSLLAGPAGLILAGVTAVALLWKEEDKLKAATDALNTSTEDYTQKLKEQTEAQNRLALIKLEESQAALRHELQQTAVEYANQTRLVDAAIATSQRYGETEAETQTRVQFFQNKAIELKARLDQQTKDLNASEERRQQILDELNRKQNEANPITAAAAAALGKYQTAVEQAEIAQRNARAELDKLTPGTLDYGIAVGKAAAADVALQTAQERLTKAQSDFNAENQRLLRELPEATKKVDDHALAVTAGITEFEQGVTSAKNYADGIKGLVDAELAGIRAEIALAEAKGDTAKAQELAQQLAIKEAEGALRVAEAQQQIQAAEYAVAVAKRNQLEAIENKTAAQLEELRVAELVVQKELAEAQAAGVNVQAKQALLQKIHELNAVKGGSTQQQQQNTEATEKNTEATEENTKASEKNNQKKSDGIGLTKVLNDAIAYSGQLTRELSAATENLFKQYLWSRNQKEALAFNTEMESYLYKLRQAPEAYAEINQKIAQMSAASRDAERDILMATNGVARLFGYINKATADATLAFYEQQLAAEKLADKYEEVAKTGESGFGNINVALQAIQRDIDVTIGSFDLLDDEDLSRLRAAMDNANDKLREMQEETQSARERLAEMNAELLEAQGMDQKAELLRQQLDYQQQLAEIERQRQEAEAMGNRELINILNQQQSVLENINQTKMDNIKQSYEEGEQADQATRRMRDYANETERAARATRTLGDSSLARLAGETEVLQQNLAKVNALL